MLVLGNLIFKLVFVVVYKPPVGRVVLALLVARTSRNYFHNLRILACELLEIWVQHCSVYIAL